MKTLTALIIPEFNTKLFVIRFNRLLAWSLLISPVVQIMMGTGFWRGLVFDLVLLLVHAALSLALFGTPRAASFRHQHLLMRFFGGSRASLTGRDRFLLDTWRIPLSLINLTLLIALYFLVFSLLHIWGWLDLMALPMMCAFLFFNLLLPVSIFRHVRDASSYAYRRWHVPAEQVVWLGWSTMAVFVVLSLVNLFKGLWL